MVRGFSVVAEEVRKLAEQTATSVTEITGIVENIQNGFGIVTESLQLDIKKWKEERLKLKQQVKHFNDISKQVTEMVDSIKNISVKSITYCINKSGNE